MMSPRGRDGSIEDVHTLRRVVAWVLGVVLLAATAGALGIALYPTVTSGAAMAVLSGSMSPAHPVGSMVFTRPVHPADVVVGDVITFQRPSDPAELVTHRVLAVDTSTGAPVFTTKGDANDGVDLDPVPASLVQGRLWFGVPQLGRVAAVLHSPQGVGFLVLLICAVVAAHPGKRKEQAAEPVGEPAPEPRRPRSGPAREAADEARTVSLYRVDAPVRAVALPPVPPSRGIPARPRA
ncbi:signal peptidase I [Geodermatophilus sp. SYSU D00691]